VPAPPAETAAEAAPSAQPVTKPQEPESPDIGEALEPHLAEESPALETLPAAPVAEPEPVTPPVARGPQPCPACGTIAKPEQRYCEDCGWLFGAEAPGPVAAASSTTPELSTRGADMSATTPGRLRNRFEK